MKPEKSILHQLMAVIEDRREHPGANSYTSKLLTAGTEKIGSKILEEAAEVVEAAQEPGEAGRKHLIYEAGDLTYHLLVMLGLHRITLDELEEELGRRFGISGLDEKASRLPKSS